MAWDAPRRYDPLPRSLGLPHFSVDELDLHKSALDIHNAQGSILTMPGKLSPIHEDRRFPPGDAPLQVHVTAKFHDPAIRFTYNQSYHSSQSFVPTDRICRGLVRRIQHCSEEGITRKDSDALNATQCLRKGPKPLRFELTFEVARAGHSGIWAQRSFKSYQKHALTTASANEVLRSTHRIIGLFMRRHDKAFEWIDEPARDYFPHKPETFKPSSDGTLNLACVPRSLFIESHQNWEFVSGYSLELIFKSSNPARRQSEIRKTLRVNSKQNTPLNLGLAEDLLWQAHRCLQDVLDQKKSSFDLEHADCDGFDGLPDCDCQHYDENALDIGLRVVNNLGPLYDHLQRSTQSRLRLFTHSTGQDCDEFLHKVQARLIQFRDQTDKKMEKLNDFDFRIAELTGHGWREKNCARFIIDGERNHSRRSTQALLDRIRTGVSDILRGNDVAIRMIAYKRGHLVLDKALIARDHQSTPGLRYPSVAQHQQHSLVRELKTRIQDDINMVCMDTCNIDDILDMGHESGQQNLCQPRPAFPSAQPFTPGDTPQGQVRPGSPVNFATRPPTPPEIPTRSSSRVFPLVPAKYREDEEWRGKALSPVRDPAADKKGHGDLKFSKIAVDVEVPPDPLQNDHKGITHTNNNDILKPAAEVYPASKDEYETDSNSTHSSMPALTESDDTPSPGQSMLITPSCLRSSSPVPHEAPSYEDLRSHQFSSPFVMDASAPSSITFSDVDRFENLKTAMPRKADLSSRCPGTPEYPEAMHSVTANTPKVPEEASGDEMTPVPQRSMQQHNETNKTRDAGNGAVSNRIAAKTEPLEAVSRRLPTENKVLSPMDGSLSCETPAESHEKSELRESIAECDSSETLRPPLVMQQGSIDGLAGLRDIDPLKSRNARQAPISEQRCPKANGGASESQHSVPTREAVFNSEVDSEEHGLTAMTIDDELSRSKIDFFEQDEDSAIESEPKGDTSRAQAGLRRMGMSERSESIGHVLLFSDSGINIRPSSEATDRSGSELEQKHCLSPIDESAFEFDVDHDESSLSGHELSRTELERECASDPCVNENVRRGDELLPVNTQDSLTDTIERAESPSEESEPLEKGSNPVPTQATEPVKLPKVRNPDPAFTARAVSNPQPSPAHVGQGGVQLLPSLPIFSTLRSVSHDTRASWSTSSSWEDFASTCRRSSDSVDTIKASLAASEDDDHPDSPKRLGTPTAGLLGLHESRWAEFGIRTALTGSHAFDRPSTAPLLESPESPHYDGQPKTQLKHADEKMVQESSSSPRKSIHLRQKKSIGNIIMASKLKRKESKELKKQKSVELRSRKKTQPKLSKESTATGEDNDGAARFPRAMMLVAGLAFASSVVSRNHS